MSSKMRSISVGRWLPRLSSKLAHDYLFLSMHIPQLPLVFLLVMNSPPSPSFIHTVYPRSTLALLRVHQVASPAGLLMAKEVLSKVRYPSILLAQQQLTTELTSP